MIAEPGIERDAPLWAEVAAPAEAVADVPLEGDAAIAATVETVEAPPEPAAPAEAAPAVTPAPAAGDRAAGIRFADEVLTPAGPAAETAKGKRRTRRAAPARETEEQARARRAAAGRRGDGRRALDEEIEEELDAVVDTDDDFGFLAAENEEK